MSEQTDPRIVETPGTCGGSARVAGTRITVYGLERYRRVGKSADQIVGMFPWLERTDVLAAWSYAEQHPDEITLEDR